MFCLQIHALAGSTMNSKFSILHEATPRAVLKISRSLCSQRVRVFVNKTLTTVSNHNYTIVRVHGFSYFRPVNKSEFVVQLFLVLNKTNSIHQSSIVIL